VVNYPVLTELNHYGVISAGGVLLIPYIDTSLFKIHIKYFEYNTMLFEFCPQMTFTSESINSFNFAMTDDISSNFTLLAPFVPLVD